MSDSDRDPEEDLAEVADELAVALRQLRDELEEDRRGRLRPDRRERRGPLGLPRPPSVGELLEFADEFAIPTLIAILEANIKLLESVQGAIRVANTGRRARDRTREAGEDAVSTADEVSRKALERLEDGLDDLRTAIEGGALPEDHAGSDLLEEIDELQADIDERIERARRQRQQTRDERRREQRGDGDATNGSADEDGVNVDVDAELDSLKERYDEDDEDDEDE